MNRLPSLYISHGSPMTALTPGLVGVRLAELAAQLPRPRAIVMASAHWLTRQPVVGGHPQPPTIHDFGGFPQALFDLQYPAPGDPALAGEVAQRLAAAGLPAAVDPTRGLDHGAWVPLRLLYPQADIPVVPLALQPLQGPAHQFALGRALAPLRGQGVLLIGSGSITHNLHDFREYQRGGEAPYVRPSSNGWSSACRPTTAPRCSTTAGRRRMPNARTPPTSTSSRCISPSARPAVTCWVRSASMPVSMRACWRWTSTASMARRPDVAAVGRGSGWVW